MTQTTAERIATLINEGVDCSCDGGWTHESVVGVLEVAAVIAAEIDALTRERDEARAEADGLAAQLSSADRSREATEDRLNRLESALAIAGIYPFAGDYAAAVYALHGDVIAVRAALDRAVGERDEARAEVERLRPAAEAWEALEASLYADANADSYAETGYMRHKAEAAAARARAAKESQP